MANSKNVELGTLDLYTWNWIGGGYNSCMARNRKEAISKAREIGKSGSARYVTLVPNLDTLRQVTAAEMVEIDRSWRSYCD